MPRIATERTVNLRTQGRGTVACVLLPIQNTGGRDLELRKIRSSCGCITITDQDDRVFDPQSPFVIPARAQRALKSRLTVRETGGAGQFRETVTFETNDPGEPQVKIEIIGTVQGFLVSSPAEIVFGRLKNGSTAKFALELCDSGIANPRPIARVESSAPDCLSATLVPAGANALRTASGSVRQVARVEVILTCPKKPRTINEQVRVYCEGDSQPVLSVPVRSDVIGTFQVLPSTIVLPQIVGGEASLRARLLCRHVDGESLTLTPIEVPADLGVQVHDSDQSGNRFVSIEWRPRDLPPGSTTIRHTVRLQAITRETMEVLEIPVKCLPGNLPRKSPR